jgi:hypothetical protein
VGQDYAEQVVELRLAPRVYQPNGEFACLGLTESGAGVVKGRAGGAEDCDARGGVRKGVAKVTLVMVIPPIWPRLNQQLACRGCAPAMERALHAMGEAPFARWPIRAEKTKQDSPIRQSPGRR